MTQRGHVCCQGVVSNCVDSHLELPQRIIIQGRNGPLVECHHQEIICNFQHHWFGHTKYCGCVRHDEKNEKKYNIQNSHNIQCIST